ncbi:hypothetical protein M0802_015866 [Mischocyttarus mexicanus]|nr:hypothetical protein M0802_015866 [Mischocyttarus mexicanus]
MLRHRDVQQSPSPPPSPPSPPPPTILHYYYYTFDRERERQEEEEEEKDSNTNKKGQKVSNVQVLERVCKKRAEQQAVAEFCGFALKLSFGRKIEKDERKKGVRRGGGAKKAAGGWRAR